MARLARLMALLGVLCLALTILLPAPIGGPGNRRVTPHLFLFAAAVALFILSATMWVVEIRSRAER